MAGRRNDEIVRRVEREFIRRAPDIDHLPVFIGRRFRQGDERQLLGIVAGQIFRQPRIVVRGKVVKHDRVLSDGVGELRFLVARRGDRAV